MARPMRPREFDRPFWEAIRSGLGVKSAARATGMSSTTAKRVFGKAGGVNPVPVNAPVGRYLSWFEREEIAALTHAGHGVREVARRTGRSPATISARDNTSGPVPRPRRSTSSTAVTGRITAARVISQMPPRGASPASGVSMAA